MGGLIDDDVILRSLANIYNKNFNPDKDIEPEAFRAVWNKINEATQEGFGKVKPKDPDYDFYNQIQTNNAVFAAFKVHRAGQDMAAQLLDEKGNLKTFKQWSNDVLPIASHQYGPWLKTEYNTAVIRAHQAADWQQFERDKDVFPNLEWMPSTSVHPGEDHIIFWGTIMPIDDPFWDAHHPGDRWNCKCSLQQTDKEPTGVPDDIKQIDKSQPGLENNPGKDAKLFSDSHPYIANASEEVKENIENMTYPIKCKLEIGRLVTWTKDNLPETKVGKFKAKRFVVKNGDSEIIVNKSFYKEVASKYKDDEYYLERLKMSRNAHIWIQKAKKVRTEIPNDHPDADRFDVYEYKYRGVVYELKCKHNGDGTFLYYMRRK